MIRWFICFLWGHKLNKDDSKWVNVIYPYSEDERHLTMYCNRCEKYRRVL